MKCAVLAVANKSHPGSRQVLQVADERVFLCLAVVREEDGAATIGVVAPADRRGVEGAVEVVAGVLTVELAVAVGDVTLNKNLEHCEEAA